MNIKKAINLIRESYYIKSDSYQHMLLVKKLVVDEKLPFDLDSVRCKQDIILNHYLNNSEKFKDEILNYIYNNKNLWSTYNRCTETILSCNNDKLMITTKIYDGDMCFGEKQDLKFSISIEISEELVNENFSKLLAEYISELAVKKYNKKLEEQRQKAIKNITKEILESLK